MYLCYNRFDIDFIFDIGLFRFCIFPFYASKWLLLCASVTLLWGLKVILCHSSQKSYQSTQTFFSTRTYLWKSKIIKTSTFTQSALFEHCPFFNDLSSFASLSLNRSLTVQTYHLRQITCNLTMATTRTLPCCSHLLASSKKLFITKVKKNKKTND